MIDLNRSYIFDCSGFEGLYSICDLIHGDTYMIIEIDKDDYAVIDYKGDIVDTIHLNRLDIEDLFVPTHTVFDDALDRLLD